MFGNDNYGRNISLERVIIMLFEMALEVFFLKVQL